MEEIECKYFTGRIARLVNSLVGFFDDIKLEIGSSKEIGDIIRIIFNKFKNDLIKKDRH